MMVNASFNLLLEKLKSYKRKYYINMLLKGGIVSLSILSSSFVAFNILEYYGRFNTPVRLSFFFTYITLVSFVFIQWIIRPAIKLFNLNQQMSDEDASIQIGKYFPEISDKLLNTLQLKRLSKDEGDLIEASISQKTTELSVVPFVNAISFRENKKRARLLIIPFFVIFSILIFNRQIFVESSSRILHYNDAFEYPAPFQFLISNKKLSAFKNEDFELKLNLKGTTFPENVYIISNGKKSKMKKDALGIFSYDFKNIQRSEDFQFEAAGYNSKNYTLEVFNRPDLRSFEAFLHYPNYLGKKDESLKNAGNFTVPEGTSITWDFKAVDADKLYLNFSADALKTIVVKPENKSFKFTKRSLKSETYQIELENNFSRSKEKISYYLNVIPDEFPAINVEQFKDTVLFNFISLGGNIADDYGLSALKLFYKISSKKNEGEFYSFPISIEHRSNNQNFFFNWQIDSLNIHPGDNIEYYLQIWDNDGVNGSKSTKSKSFDFHLPTEEEIEKQISTASKETESQLEKTLKKSTSLQEDINKLENKLKTKTSLNWQDKQMLEDVLKKHEELKKEIEQLKKMNEKLNEKNEKFKEQDPETANKIEQLQKLMDELLDEETKKLFEELNKLLQQQDKKDEIQKLLEQMKKDENLDKELERALEMFKELKFEQKLNETIKDLKELSKEQKELSEKTSEQKESNEKLSEEQQKLNDEFQKIQEALKELSDLNNSLENKKEMSETSPQQEEISKEQQKSSEQLKNNQNKKAGNSQKNASEKMEQMANKMEQMKSEMQSSEAQENIDDLRDILENLITLSFDQEDLMKEFRKVNHSDPRYIGLSQKQLKLWEDSKIIEDSLLALAKRVFQIQSFVTREVGDMKQNMEESTTALKERRVDIATGKQQFAMTSINNLALLLNDVLKQMQQQMAESQQQGDGKMCKKPGGKNPKPGMGDLQKQLNEQIKQLKEGGKSGRALSEELAKLAAQQEMIRNMLKDLQKNPGGSKAGEDLNKLQKEMEETEKNLVNKQLSQDLINRQKEILTRLLEAEKSARQQGEEERREAERPKDSKKELPPSFEKYLKSKEKEIDLLKTISPSLTPYYKQEVNEYFQKIEK